MAARIVDIQELTVPIQSDMSNAVIDFSKMNVSLLALISDVVRDGSPVVGFGFNSNGRYAQGALLRDASLTEDLHRIEAVLDVLPSGCTLAVDANGHLSLDEALRYADSLAQYPLQWYEEPVDPLDYAATAELAAAYTGPLATGENLLSWQDSRNLLRHGGLRPGPDVLQMDPALSYGLVEYQHTLDTLAEFGWPRQSCVPHGGHQFNLAVAAAAGLGGIESYPGIFAPFGGLADGQPVEDGYVRMIDAPGIGLEAKSSLRPLLDELSPA